MLPFLIPIRAIKSPKGTVIKILRIAELDISTPDCPTSMLKNFNSLGKRGISRAELNPAIKYPPKIIAR
jgi:hypothetical protein